MNQQLQFAHDIILSLKGAKKAIAFEKLWKSVCSKMKIKEDNSEEMETDFYISLLENPNFIKLAGNEWTLKELFSYDEVKKISAPVYNTEEFEINEEGYQNYMSSIELKELRQKKLRMDPMHRLLDVDDQINLLDTNDDIKQLDDYDDVDEIEIEGDEYNE